MAVQILQPVNRFPVRAHRLRVRNFHIFRVTESMQNKESKVEFPHVALNLLSKPGRGYTDGAHSICAAVTQELS